jgi:hypothetical protein
MKTKARNLGILLATVIVFALTGCATTQEVAVNEAPPPPQQETMSIPPNANYFWAEGHWARRDNQWAWQSGHWILRPNARAIWEPGQWNHTKRGWVWHDGQWNNPSVY